ncbi:hypothetical protein MMC07_001438 [Pseudocyphellaria aurata]|nr:hypothetical protein [Pseudocyphellaria aurata]
MPSLRALYLNFKNDIGDLLEVTDFSILTWLAFGASLQLLCQSWLPSGLSYWLPLLYLIYRAVRASLDCGRIFTGTFTNVKFGRWTATILEPEDPSAVTATSDGVVMFLLGARINQFVFQTHYEGAIGFDDFFSNMPCLSPLGKLAPGNAEIDGVFKDMWIEAENNRTKWTYLGRSATLFDISDGEGITTFWISYWKDLKGLQGFATSSAHRLGQNAYLKKRFPYMGIMHETYHSPKGSWETIYDNTPPLGFGKAKYVIEKGPDDFELRDTLKPIEITTTMFSRMGREKPE